MILYLLCCYCSTCWLLRPWERLRSIVTKYWDEYVCLSVREDISGTTRVIFTNFLCMLPLSVSRSSSSTFTIGPIAHRREGVDRSAHRGQSVMYDCLVCVCIAGLAWHRYRPIASQHCPVIRTGSILTDLFHRLYCIPVTWRMLCLC